MVDVIKTERLILRKWKEKDADILYRLAKNPEIGRGAGWLPHKDAEYSKAIIRAVLSDDGEYAIALKDDENTPIGSIGVRIGSCENRGIMRDDEAEIGYWLGKDYWGYGYATEALSELVRYSFTEIGLNSIWCGFFDGNEKSRNVIERCGLKYHHRNEHLYNSMLSEYYNETMMRISAEEYFIRAK
ncbi:Protein N-acetyltransferase, RimJ/RimL family [Butyrivibrio sp. ob235]|uniref:GNAT family N-acetyltransferase n=1 Tax=Butyrivibrio sp. ob235 TaxID=1761780 RepID=UPI0008CD2EF9|nr:GNAT family N-acetyltransferase [Butyrivibrio sp. ob235]SEK39161.1 Protein N-acetyltransferase, RimJ/RimL family [Butyrivibrio sp. ob235]